MRIETNPSKKVLLGEDIVIKASGIEAETACIHLRRKYIDSDMDYAHASYRVKEGKINTSTDAPFDGTYEGVDITGLFWSLEDADLNPLSPILKDYDDKKGCLIIDLEVDGAIVDTTFVEVIFIKDHVEKREVTYKNIRGILFADKDRTKDLVMIHVPGEPGIEGTEHNAKILASQGVDTFAMALTGYKDLPAKHHGINIDHFGEVIAYLKETGYKRIGIMGYTRGSELALLVASKYPAIQLVVASNPSCQIYSYFRSKAPYIYQGKVLPYRKVNRLKQIKMNYQKIFNINKDHELIDLFLPLDTCDIEVESIQGDILLVSGMEDKRWHSSHMADMIEKRAGKNGYGYKISNLKYEETGQVLGVPGYTSTKYYMNNLYYVGGNCQKNGQNQRQSWIDITNFVKIHQ